MRLNNLRPLVQSLTYLQRNSIGWDSFAAYPPTNMAKEVKPSEKAAEVASTKLIKFTFAPMGAYGLGYFIGDVAEIESELADKIVANDHAEYVVESEEVVLEGAEPIINADLNSPEGAEAL